MLCLLTQSRVESSRFDPRIGAVQSLSCAIVRWQRPEQLRYRHSVGSVLSRLQPSEFRMLLFSEALSTAPRAPFERPTAYRRKSVTGKQNVGKQHVGKQTRKPSSSSGLTTVLYPSRLYLPLSESKAVWTGRDRPSLVSSLLYANDQTNSYLRRSSVVPPSHTLIGTYHHSGMDQ